MVRSASCASRTMRPRCGHPSRRLLRKLLRMRPAPQNQKSGPRARRFAKCLSPLGARAERGSTRACRLLLLRLLGLLRLLRLLRFLSHSILSRFNGWKRDTRHARRRASLATSSNAIPTDSQAAAPHCHGTVIALSTAVMRFLRLFPPSKRSASQKIALQRRSRRLGRVNIAPTPRRILRRSGTNARAIADLHQFKTTARIASEAVRVR
jgi:hypothetical protein